MTNYLKANEIYTIDDLAARVESMRASVEELRVTMDEEITRMKEIRKMPEYSATFKRLKPVFDEMQKIKFDKAKEKYKAEHAAELRQFYAARRKILDVFPDGRYDSSLLDAKYKEVEATHAETLAKFKIIREENQRIWAIQSCVNKGRGNTEQTQQQKKKSQEQEI